MRRDEQLKFCKICKEQKFDIKQGIICSLTSSPANFETSCDFFNEDSELKEQYELKLSEKVIAQKQRHGCVTAWLVLIIVVNSLITITYLFASDLITNNRSNVSTTMIVLLGILGVANIIFAVMLLQWQKFGFWGFIASSIVVMIGIEVGQSVLGLVGVAVLYIILHIKKDNVTAWDNLE